MFPILICPTPTTQPVPLCFSGQFSVFLHFLHSRELKCENTYVRQHLNAAKVGDTGNDRLPSKAPPDLIRTDNTEEMNKAVFTSLGDECFKIPVPEN